MTQVDEVEMLDSSTEQFLCALRSAPPLDWSLEHIATTRAAIKESHLSCFASTSEVPISTDLLYVTGSHGRIPISIKSPKNGISSSSVAMFVHGGGWISGDLESHAQVVDHIVAMSRATVISVGYQLSPEVRFPVALEECRSVLNWLARQYAQPISLIGDSAGGNLVAALCHMMRDESKLIEKQVLICPVLDPGNFDYLSRQRFGNGDYLLSNSEMRQMINHYLPRHADINSPLVSPLRAEAMTGLPSALIITAECDMLLDEGKAYADRLTDDGVSVEYQMFAGTVHDFPVFGDAMEKSYDALRQVAAFVCSRAIPSPARRSHKHSRTSTKSMLSE